MHNQIKPGSIVTVGPRYTTDSGVIKDRFTGQTYRVVAIRQIDGRDPAAGIFSQAAVLAPAFINAGDSDAVVSIVLRRLTVVG